MHWLFKRFNWKDEKMGYEVRLISTSNDDGTSHAAVMYKDTETGEILVADPITDVHQYESIKDID